MKATWKREFKLPWREAGPLDHHDDTVESDQQVVNKELPLSSRLRDGGVGDGSHGERDGFSRKDTQTDLTCLSNEKRKCCLGRRDGMQTESGPLRAVHLSRHK